MSSFLPDERGGSSTTGRWSPGRLSRGVLTALGSDPQDYRTPSELVVHYYLFWSATLVALLSFAMTYLAAGVVDDGLSAASRLGVAALVFLFVLFVDVWAASWQPEPRASASRVDLDRGAGRELVPRYPRWYVRAGAMVPRLLLTLVLAVALGTLGAIALNADDVREQRRILAEQQAQDVADAADAPYEEQLRQGREELEVAQEAYDRARAVEEEADRRVKCEAGQLEGTYRGIACVAGGAGLTQAVQVRQEARESLARVGQSLEARRSEVDRLAADGPPSTRDDYERETAGSGLDLTIKAWWSIASDASGDRLLSALMLAPHAVLLLLDLLTLLYKLTRGVDQPQQRRWRRLHLEIAAARRGDRREAMAADAAVEVAVATDAAVIEETRSGAIRSVVAPLVRDAVEGLARARLEKLRITDPHERGVAADPDHASPSDADGPLRDPVCGQEDAHDARAADEDVADEEVADDEQGAAVDGEDANEGQGADGDATGAGEGADSDAADDHGLAGSPTGPDRERRRSFPPTLEGFATYRSTGNSLWVIGPRIAGPGPSSPDVQRSAHAVHLAVRVPEGGRRVHLRADLDVRVVKVLTEQEAVQERDVAGRVLGTASLKPEDAVIPVDDPALALGGTIAEPHVLVMPYFPRSDASRFWVSPEGPGRATLSFRAVLEVGVSLIDALEPNWARDLVHGDVKLANILVTGGVAGLYDQLPEPDPSGVSTLHRLSDWAGAAPAGHRLPAATVQYLAPEGFGVGMPIRATATDSFAVGSSMYHLLTGATPNAMAARAAGLSSLDVHDPRWPDEYHAAWASTLARALPRETPPALAHLVMELVHPDRAERLHGASSEDRALLRRRFEAVADSCHDAGLVGPYRMGVQGGPPSPGWTRFTAFFDEVGYVMDPGSAPERTQPM